MYNPFQVHQFGDCALFADDKDGRPIMVYCHRCTDALGEGGSGKLHTIYLQPRPTSTQNSAPALTLSQNPAPALASPLAPTPPQNATVLGRYTMGISNKENLT